MGMTVEAGASRDLMRHQIEGVEFLLGRGSGLLAFEQGLGKTLVAIAAFQRLFKSKDAIRMVVICPNSLKRNWSSELDKFAPGLSWEIAEGPPVHRRKQLAATDAAVVILSYDTARAEVAGILALLGRGPTVLVLDESHAVKNRKSLASISTKHLAGAAAYRWLLSGTPITNTAGDIYSQVGIVCGKNPLGSYEGFMAIYGEKEPNASDLKEKIAPYILRRTKDQCLDLPEKNFCDIVIELPEWQRKLYNNMRDELICEFESMTGEQFHATAATALSKILRLSQLSSNPSLLLPTEPHTPAKFVELDNLIAEICEGSGEKVILWSHYVGTIRALVDRYSRLEPLVLYGGVPGEERQEIARIFQSDPRRKLLIANPAAAGTGFTFTAAKYCIYESLNWRYDFYAQSQDRIHRIGQTLPVTYIRLIADDTIEQAIAEALERKSALARALLGDENTAAPVPSLTREAALAMLRGAPTLSVRSEP
jgi:SNF2 family DNA or RNA helicase